MLITWVSRQGGRPENEDYVGSRKKAGVVCVAAADGLGGYSGGSTASKTAVDAALDSFENDTEFSAEALKRHIMAANNAIVEKSSKSDEYEDMSSTIVILLIKGKRAVWGNVGDSRLYMLHNNRIVQVTEDHSLAFLDFMDGKIEYDDIRRSDKQNKLTSALGAAASDINISDITPIDSATRFILCTDGWWEYVSEYDIEDTSKASASARDWLSGMLNILENNAPMNCDNYTAAAVVM